MRKSKILFTLIISILLSCSSSLTVVELNKAYIEKAKSLTEWDKDMLKARKELFQLIDLDLEKFDQLYLIENYDIVSGYYNGVIYLDTGETFHFSRETYQSEIKLQDKELNKTESFIIKRLKKGKLNEIREKSKKTDLMSPSALYITVAKENVFRNVKTLSLQEFYID